MADDAWLWREAPTFYGGDELHEWKLDKTHDYLDRHGLDAAIFTKSEAVRYVSDFCVKGYRPFMDLEYVAIVKQGTREPIVAYTSGSDEYRIQIRSAIADRRHARGTHGLRDALRQVISDYDLGTGRVAADLLPFDYYLQLTETFPGLSISNIDDMWEQLTCIKHPIEIGYIREAVGIVDRGMEAGFDAVAPGVAEYEVAAEIEYAMRRAGSEMEPFLTVVASGVNGCIFERLATDKLISDGELVILDAGSVYRGYTGDLGRTVCAGKPSDRQREIYRVVRDSLEAAVDAIAPGASCASVDAAARKSIAAAGYGPYEHRFATGHQLGWGLHGEPLLNRGIDFELEPGMVVCVEPRVTMYDHPEVGGVHLEQAVLVTSDGREVLSHCPFATEML